MFYPVSEVRLFRDLAAASFPRFTDWETANEMNADYAGFTLWGRLRASRRSPRSATLFVIFTSVRETWRGQLSVGKHCYFWSSADVGDALLLGTGPCPTLQEAIAKLKGQIASLFEALSGAEA